MALQRRETKEIKFRHFRPKEDLMPQLVRLNTEEKAKAWYREYIAFHNGRDQGVRYLIGYFSPDRCSELTKWMFND